MGVAQRRAPGDLHVGDAPPAGAQEIGHRLGHREGVLAVVASHRREHEGGVTDGARHRALVRERHGGTHRIGGDAGELRLDADQAAERGGDADGAAAVRAEGDRRDAGGDAGGAPRRRAARGLVGVPGVAGDAVQRAVAPALQPNSLVVVLPMMTRPCSRRRRTEGASKSATLSAVTREPKVHLTSFMATRSLTETGTPRGAPSSRPPSPVSRRRGRRPTPPPGSSR